MKKYLFALIALCSAIPLQAQFKLTDKGFVNSQDSKMNYYIIECPGMDRCDIFKAAAYFTETRLSNPWTRFSYLECDSFTVNGVALDAIYNSNPKNLFVSPYCMEFRVMFDICDGYLRVYSPVVLSLNRESTVSISIGVSVDNIQMEHYAPNDMDFLFISPNYMPDGVRLYRPGNLSVYNRRGKLNQKYAKVSLEGYFNNFVFALEDYLNNQN